MKYLVLLTFLAAGCLICLVSFTDLSDMSFLGSDRGGPSAESNLDSLPDSGSAIADNEPGLDLASGSAPELVLMKFGAPWCGPCRMIDKELDKLEQSNLPVKIQKINVDDRPDMAREYKVRSIPRLVLLQNGEKVGDLVGYKSAEELTDWIEDSASKQALAAKKRPSGPAVVQGNPFFN